MQLPQSQRRCSTPGNMKREKANNGKERRVRLKKEFGGEKLMQKNDHGQLTKKNPKLRDWVRGGQTHTPHNAGPRLKRNLYGSAEVGIKGAVGRRS